LEYYRKPKAFRKYVNMDAMTTRQSTRRKNIEKDTTQNFHKILTRITLGL
jgi:hypothetical protein